MKKLFALKNRKGFTLVELMVVVAIMGILVAVAIPVYNGVTEKAELSTCQANQRTIESAIMMYNVQNSTKLPAANHTELKTALVDGTTKYLVEMPNCPSATKNEVTATTGTYAADANGKVSCTSGVGTTAHNVARGNGGK